MLWEAEYDEKALNGHFDDGFADKARAEEHTERDQEVAAEEPRQVKQGVRDWGQG